MAAARTVGAGEMVANFAKENHLATIVGTRTADEVLGGANFKLAGGYILRMPVAGWYNVARGMHRRHRG